MLKLLTKFKTQSLNEVKPYENNGSFVSFCGEIQNYDDDGGHNQYWQQDTCGSERDQVNGGLNDSKAGLTSTCFISKLPNDMVKTIHSPTEVPSDKSLQLSQENKENGDKRSCLSQERQEGMSAEKRKWSDMKSHRWKQLGCSSDSSSSDEEVKELFSKQKRSEQYNSVRSGKVRPWESHARKRHRQTFSEDRIYRPSLDFEKMQQKVFWKRNLYTTSRPRIVKVRSFSGHPHNLLPDPSVVSFKPIKGIQAFKLTPVEDPQALAF